MKIIMLITIFLISNISILKSQEEIQPNFFTQFEPDAFESFYTAITTNMANFQKKKWF